MNQTNILDMLPLVIAPQPILRAIAKPVELPLSESVVLLGAELLQAMKHYRGIGLAAPQVAAGIRMVAVGANVTPKVYINPEVVKRSWKKVDFEEGCLSLPGLYGIVRRPERVLARYYDVAGSRHEEWLEGLVARVYQHEVDHLNGILFFDLTSSFTAGEELLTNYRAIPR